MHSVLPKILRFTGLATLVLLFLLIADVVLWNLPRLFRGWHGGAFKSHCSQVKQGMSRDQVLEIMHQGASLASEYEIKRAEPTPTHRVQFSKPGGNGICTVELDPLKGTVTSVQFDDRFDEISMRLTSPE